MNIVILLVTNNRQTHRNEVMNSGQALPAFWQNQTNVSSGLQGAKLHAFKQNSAQGANVSQKGAAGFDSLSMKNGPKPLNNGVPINTTEDLQLQSFNQLCQKTPEGYLITLEQRQFEGKESYQEMGKDQKLGKNKRYNTQASMNMSAKNRKDKPAQGKQMPLAKEVEKVFLKVCQSLELYKTDNIPIVTEFLEF